GRRGWQGNGLAARRVLELGDGLGGEGMPVAHGYEAAGVYAKRLQSGLERAGLTLGEAPDGRAAANHGIVVLNFFGTRAGNQFSERAATDASEREVDDVGIAEHIKKKRLDGFQRMGTIELAQNYPHTP